jgi:disulfide bond formation protein DsbB
MFARVFARPVAAVLNEIDNSPRRVMACLSVACVVMLAFGLYLQHAMGLEPCPMCIVQRYALVFVAVFGAASAMMAKKKPQIIGMVLLATTAAAGAFVAARQTWLQWYPPEIVSCGRDLYGMIETFPLKRLVPMIFRGGGDCTKVDWTFLGGSIANWSFVCFSLMVVLTVTMLVRRR